MHNTLKRFIYRQNNNIKKENYYYYYYYAVIILLSHFVLQKHYCNSKQCIFFLLSPKYCKSNARGHLTCIHKIPFQTLFCCFSWIYFMVNCSSCRAQSSFQIQSHLSGFLNDKQKVQVAWKPIFIQLKSF